ncbi:MAG: FecR domain-containing protein [Candidatus Didemnitutus sp.]|nr:FecR domain-containing protein [Candidatus Didemnitutus sp.]
MKSDPKPHDPTPEKILEAAADWLARRDRGLSAAEQDDYMHWLRADPRHAEALAQHAAALERMMQLYEWTPAHDTEPNPDLFAPPPARSRAWWRWASAGLAAAATIALVFFLWERPWSRPDAAAVAAAPKSYLRVNERLALPDGSRVELKDGSRLVVQYSEKERRVKLTGGEAHFSVWKDAQRPFVVDAAGVEVRAVGTAFNVRLDAQDVQVLVTEGRVKVEQAGATGPAPVFVSVGQMATVNRAETSAPAIATVTTEDIARELAWQAPRLQFNETPLADAIAEFNRLNRQQLELGDPELGALRIGGTFRPDNVEGFVRLLVNDTDLGVRAETAGENRTVLRRAR